jgi:hypothetical protein
MSNSDPRSWIDRFVGVCLSLLIGATAVYVAVRLIEAVWSALLVIISVGVFVALAIAALRRRSSGW